MVRLVGQYMDPDAIICIEGNRQITGAILAEKFDAIFFTGSPSVGRVVAQAAAKHLCPVVLELGGKSPCIVTPSANLYMSARRIVWGAMLNSGQTCVRPDTLFVHESVADEFVNQVAAAIKEFYGGDTKGSPYYGRLVNDAAFDRITKCMADAQKFKVYGGAMDKVERYIEPTVYDFGKDWPAFEKSELAQDEVFGPIIYFARYTDIDREVIPFIRARPKPLALYLFSNDSATNESVLRNTTSGGAIINDVIVHLSNASLPFGGVGESGLGSYHGKRTFDNFTHQKAVLRRTFWVDPPQRYPPYTQDKVMMMTLAFYPPINYYYNKFMGLMTDKKNLLILALSAHAIQNYVRKSKM